MAAGSMSFEKSETKRSVAPGTPPPVQRRASIRVIARKPGEKGTRCRVVVSAGAADEQDVTGVLTASLAHALWQLRGGMDLGNWVDGEMLLDQLLSPNQAQEPTPAAPMTDVIVPSKRPVARR